MIQSRYSTAYVSSQEKEMEKQKILYQQARLHARGAAEMVLQMISATKGDNESVFVGPQQNEKASVYQSCHSLVHSGVLAPYEVLIHFRCVLLNVRFNNCQCFVFY